MYIATNGRRFLCTENEFLLRTNMVCLFLLELKSCKKLGGQAAGSLESKYYNYGNSLFEFLTS